MLLDGRPLAELIRPTRAAAACTVLPAHRDLVGAEIELVGRARPRAPPAPGARAGRPRLRLRHHRLPAVARPAHAERARRRRRGAHPDAVRVLRARGARAAVATIELVRARAQPAPRDRGHPALHVRRAHQPDRAGGRGGARRTSTARSSRPSSRATCACRRPLVRQADPALRRRLTRRAELPGARRASSCGAQSRPAGAAR